MSKAGGSGLHMAKKENAIIVFKRDLLSVVRSIGDPPTEMLPVNGSILDSWTVDKRLNPNVSEAVRLHQQRLLSLLSARSIPGAQIRQIVFCILALSQILARDLFHVNHRPKALEVYRMMQTYVAHVQRINNDTSAWHTFLIEARTQLARGDIFDYDQCRFDSAEKAKAERLRSALTQQLRISYEALQFFRSREHLSSMEALTFISILDTVAVLSDRLGRRARVTEVYFIYRGLLNKTLRSAVEQTPLLANDLALLSLQFLSLIANTRILTREMVPSEITIFNEEIALLDELVKLAGNSNGQVAAAASSSSGPSRSPIQAATLRFILMMRSMRSFLTRNLAAAGRELNAVGEFDAVHPKDVSGVSEPMYAYYRATVMYACVTDEEFDADAVRRGQLLDDTIRQMSKVVQQNYAVKFLTPGHTLVEKLAHCHALRDTLEANPEFRGAAILESAEYIYHDSAWEKTACSSLSCVQLVTSDLRQAICRLIDEGNFAEAIALTQNVYGIGNAAVLHRFDAKDSGWGEGTLALTCPQRTPRIGPLQFQPQTVMVDGEQVTTPGELSDVLLSITLAHEDTHRRQFWHLGHIDLKKAEKELSHLEHQRLVQMHKRELLLLEACAYYSEIASLQACIDHLQLPASHRTILEQMQGLSRDRAAEELAKFLQAFPVFHDIALDDLVDVSTCQRLLDYARNQSDIPSGFFVEGQAQSMYTRFQTDGATLISASSSSGSSSASEAGRAASRVVGNEDSDTESQA